MKNLRRNRPGPTGKNPLPLSLAMIILACVLALVIAYFRDTGNIGVAFGDGLLIEALVLFGVAWVGYLKKDGIRVMPAKKSDGIRTAESWRDRVPSLGEPPAPAMPLPGAEGPENAEYRRLAEVEEKLRRKILEGRQTEEGQKEGKRRSSGYGRSAVISGIVLLVLALCFEYLLPFLSP